MIKQIELPETQAKYLRILYQSAEAANKTFQVAMGVVLAGHSVETAKSAHIENNMLIYDDGQPDA